MVLRVRRFRRFAWTVLGITLAVIVWGAYVRASGSGAGCGSHWPTCQGEVLPRPKSLEMLVELLHRTTSGLLTFLIVGLLVWALRLFGRGHPARKAAIASCVFLVIEALVGAALVKLDLVARNASPARGVWMAAHLVNTFALLGALALTAYGARVEATELRPWSKPAWVALGGAFAGMLVVGTSGAIAALGDTLFPSSSLIAGFASDFEPTTHVFLRLRLWHPVAAALVGGYLVAMVRLVPGLQSAPARLPGRVLVRVVVAQLALGAANLLLLAPIALQLAHLLLADVLWVGLVLFAASTREIGKT